MPNPLQDDYVRFPASTRGGPELAALVAKQAAEGAFELEHEEVMWAGLYDYLLSRGYRLRPRYKPGWTPPWLDTDIYPMEFEESEPIGLPGVIDARRESDDALVALKWCPADSTTRYELEVMQYLSSPQYRSDPQNHCNPVLDSFPHPEGLSGVFIVSPWLHGFELYPIESVNETIELMLQLFEGLAFMHRVGVAHRDCTKANILQDAECAFPGPSHPIFLGRKLDWRGHMNPVPRYRTSVRYYFIDFGVSLRFEGNGPHLALGTICRDNTAPELSNSIPFDPFRLDIYLLGNFFLTDYVNKYNNLEFLRPLLLDMTQRKPSSRPTAEEALQRLRESALHPSGISFRWRLRSRDEGVLKAVVLDIGSLLWEGYLQVRHLLDRRPLTFGRRRPPS